MCCLMIGVIAASGCFKLSFETPCKYNDWVLTMVIQLKFTHAVVGCWLNNTVRMRCWSGKNDIDATSIMFAIVIIVK